MKQKIKVMEIVRVGKYEFETSDGQVFDHLIPYDEDPSLEEFQMIHNLCHKSISDLLSGDDNETDDIDK